MTVASQHQNHKVDWRKIISKKMMQVLLLFKLLGMLSASSIARAETVYVTHKGVVNLASYSCQEINRSSLVWRLCANRDSSSVIVNLKGSYYEYCGMGDSAFKRWMLADSLGRYYNSYVKGKYDCHNK